MEQHAEEASWKANALRAKAAEAQEQSQALLAKANAERLYAQESQFKAEAAARESEKLLKAAGNVSVRCANRIESTEVFFYS